MVPGPPLMRVFAPGRLGWDLDVGREEELRRGPGRDVEDLAGGRVLGRRAALSRQSLAAGATPGKGLSSGERRPREGRFAEGRGASLGEWSRVAEGDGLLEASGKLCRGKGLAADGGAGGVTSDPYGRMQFLLCTGRITATTDI